MKSYSEKQKLGAFYTPKEVSDIMCHWAIKKSTDLILEPSFGGCGFIDSTVSRLRQLGNAKPYRNISGCDIDPEAFKHLSDSMGPVSVGYEDRFILQDFLTLSPYDYKIKKYDVVIGNPPYIAHQKLNEKQRYLSGLLLSEHGIKTSKKVNLWMLFVLNALSFLKDGGRIAFVLPATGLTAGYSQELFSLLESKFSTVGCVVLKERIFLGEGAKEKCMVLTAEGFNTTPLDKPFTVKHCLGIRDLQKAISGIRSRKRDISLGTKLNLASLITSRAVMSYNALSSHSATYSGSELFSVRIGVVTGDKSFFIMNNTTASNYGLNAFKHFDPIVCSMEQLKGAFYTKKEILSQVKSDVDCLLLSHQKHNMKSSRYRDYLSSYCEKKFNKNVTFSKREPWNKVNDDFIPDAFMSYMGQYGPRIVINNAKINSTNSIHRLYFASSFKNKKIQKLIAISLLSNFTQLSAELNCRHYGSGVLKIEPSDAKKLKIIIPTDLSDDVIEQAFTTIDSLLRKNNFFSASRVSDKLLMSSSQIGPIYKQNLSHIAKARLFLQEHRQP
ncbi:MAG: SAM-dependent methyltransferase [Pseudomonadales bacterium]|nr:SAM-dependent methyltransferase [Pseudomonadales bacterium]